MLLKPVWRFKYAPDWVVEDGLRDVMSEFVVLEQGSALREVVLLAAVLLAAVLLAAVLRGVVLLAAVLLAAVLRGVVLLAAVLHCAMLLAVVPNELRCDKCSEQWCAHAENEKTTINFQQDDPNTNNTYIVDEHSRNRLAS